MKSFLSVLCLLSFGWIALDVVGPSVHEEVEVCPAVPDFTQFFQQVPSLGRRVRVASPCIGIDACGHALDYMGVPADMCNAYDLEAGYMDVLMRRMREAGMEVIKLHLGREQGNLLKVGLLDLESPVDFLVSGPPCPPWAGQGNKRGLNDERAAVFVRVLMWVFFFVKCGGLLGCILENVVGITHEVDGIESAMSKFLRVLSNYLPEFAWKVDILKATEYMLPQTRVRVFLRGIRKLISNTVPPCLPPFGHRDIRECLGDFPYTPRSAYTGPQQRNLKQFEQVICRRVREGTLEMDDVVFVSVDRSEDRIYKQIITVNAAPTLTTHNVYLVVLSVGDVVQSVPDSERRFFRLLADSERLALQGIPPKLLLSLPQGKAVLASGNTFPTSLIIACMQPLLMSIARSSVDFKSWPPPHFLKRTLPTGIDSFIRAVKAKGRRMKAGPSQARKRRRSDSDD